MYLVYPIHKPIHQRPPLLLMCHIMWEIILMLNESHTSKYKVKPTPDNLGVTQNRGILITYLLDVYYTLKHNIQNIHGFTE